MAHRSRTVAKMNRERHERAREQSHQGRLLAYNMRLQGMPYHAIAETLRVSRETVRKYVHEWMDKLEIEKVEEIRQMELDRLDKLQFAVDDMLASPNPKVRLSAIEKAVKLQESRRKLLGLDAAEKVDVEINHKSQAEIDLEKLIAEANARLHEEEMRIKNAATEQQAE